jgi:uncharacterized membrane protein
MFDFLWIVLFVVLFINVSNLKDTVRRLEKRLNSTSVSTVQQQAGSQTVPVHVPTPSVSGLSGGAQVHPEVQGDGPVLAWLKENWLSKLGILLILIGFGWFISYAFVHNWIGPVGRVGLGLAVGALLAALGAWRMSKDAVQANVLIVLGSALVLITGYAARVVYDFFTPASVLMLSALVAVYIATVALMYNREKLAVYGVLIALVAPLFTHAPEPSVVGLYLYLGVITVASVWLAVWRGWGSVNLAALLGVLLYTAPFIFGATVGEPDKVAVIIVTSLLSLLFFVVNVFEVVRRGEVYEKSAVYIAVGNALLILGTTLGLVVEELQSLLLAAWMIIFAAGSLYVSAQLKKQTFFYIYGLIAILFLGIATAIELSGPVLTVAFMLEGAIVTLLTYVATKKLANAAGMSLLMVIPALVSLESLEQSRWGTSLAHQDGAVVLLMTIILFVLGFFIAHRYHSQAHPASVRTAYITLLSFAAAYGFAYVWLGSHAIWYEDLATILSLALYTVTGIVAYVQGALTERVALKRFGSVVLVLVIARLVLIDVWQMPLAPRIITFMLIGVLLVSTAFIGRRKKALVATSHEQIQG